MNYFCSMVDQQKAFSLISSWDEWDPFSLRSSASRISDIVQAGFEPAQSLSSVFVEWSCTIVITTTPECLFSVVCYSIWISSFNIGSFVLMNLLSNLFFADLDFCKPRVIQSLDLNLNLFLSILLRGGYVSNKILIFSKYIWIELSTFSSSIFSKSRQLIEK